MLTSTAVDYPLSGELKTKIDYVISTHDNAGFKRNALRTGAGGVLFGGKTRFAYYSDFRLLEFLRAAFFYPSRKISHSDMQFPRLSRKSSEY